jgi:hypothetical protein
MKLAFALALPALAQGKESDRVAGELLFRQPLDMQRCDMGPAGAAMARRSFR